MTTKPRLTLSLLALALSACASSHAGETTPRYDLIIRNGVVYDGSGAAPQRVDVAVRGNPSANPRARREAKIIRRGTGTR